MQEVFRLEVYRIPAITSMVCLTVSKRVLGCLSHYKGTSIYCRGKDCPSSVHAVDATWKGYIGVQVFLRDANTWRPYVLEVSENLELDMRGLYGPNQVWEIYRLPGRKKHGGKLEGKMLEDRGEDGALPVFDILPPVRTMYHATDLVLNVENPMPDRVVVKGADIPPPVHLASKPKDEESAPFDLQEALRIMNNRKKSPQTAKNGQKTHN